MFGLEILDIVIGLTFVYLLLSLLASALNEYLAALLNLRGKELARGLGRLLDDVADDVGDKKAKKKAARSAVQKAFDGVGPEPTGADAPLTERFYNHRLIRPLATRRGWLLGWLSSEPRLPSYIPARTFAMALLDVLGYEDPQATDPTPADGTREAELVKIMQVLQRESPLDVGELKGLLARTGVPDTLMPRMLDALTGSQNRLQHLHDGVEVWFNNAMDRVSGAYKRTTQGWLFVLGLIIAAGSNADTVDMWRRLAANDELRTAMAQRAARTLPALADTTTASDTTAAADTTTASDTTAAADTTPGDTTTANTTEEDATEEDAAASNTAAADKAWKDYELAKSQLDSMELKLGWTTEDAVKAGLLKPDSKTVDWFPPNQTVDWFPFDRGGFWIKLLGLLLTALAISLGAPFWFDLLNKVISIRAAGRSPEEKPKSPEGAPKRRAEHTPK